MNRAKLCVLLMILLVVSTMYYYGFADFLSFSYLKQQQAMLEAFKQAHPWQLTFGFFGTYVLVTALSFPGAAVMTLLAGAIFGVFWGTVLVSFASSIGALLAFLLARWFFYDSVQQKAGASLQRINEGIKREGAFYLFTLRLVPIFPFFVVNLALALTPIRAVTFYWVSQLGMLLGTVVYVNAGTQLAQLSSMSGILSPMLLASFAALGLLPLLTKKIIEKLKAHQVYRGHKKPRRFDNNLIVIGAGAAGLVSAYIASAVKAKVTLIEQHQMGGDCLNTGCVPSKALIKTARVHQQIKKAQELGINAAIDIDFAQVMASVQRVVQAIEPHDSIDRYSKLGVNCLQGRAEIISPWTVRVNEQQITAKNIIVASGAAPFVPNIPGLDEVTYYTSDTIWSLSVLPQRLLVLGGGPIGCELSQAFASLGAKVTQLEMADRLLVREDKVVSDYMADVFAQAGITVCVGHQAKSFKRIGARQIVICETQGQEREIEFDAVLLALGRVPRLKGFGLEKLGIETDGRVLPTNDYLQSLYPNIYACGDVAGPYQFTHTAAHQAWFAAVNALFGRFKKFRVDYSVIPWSTFTTPEVARVGLNEQEAQAQGIAYELACFEVSELDRAIAERAATGFIQVLTVPGKDKILGVTIVADNAGDMLAEFVLAMKHKLGLKKILGTIHAYPTWMEANKFVAGVWQQQHKPEKILTWLAKYHQWQRG